MKVTFIPNSGGPVEVFNYEDCTPEYQEYLDMMLEEADAQYRAATGYSGPDKMKFTSVST